MQDLKRLLPKFNLLVIVFVLVILSCENRYSSKFSNLEDLIKTTLPVNRITDKEILFVLAEYDCEICVNDLFIWVAEGKKSNSDLNMLGLYFQSGKKFTYTDVIENTKNDIQWIRLSETEILEELANLLPKEKGPFAITLYNKRISDIYPINKSSFKD